MKSVPGILGQFRRSVTGGRPRAPGQVGETRARIRMSVGESKAPISRSRRASSASAPPLDGAGIGVARVLRLRACPGAEDQGHRAEDERADPAAELA